ncbi:hypothetical protein NEOKW01_1048 [Nematocida sp. AWRm80]|nr:hypothetical protein NEOKW01_1048 [Nematocida sp. AWRm80]
MITELPKLKLARPKGVEETVSQAMKIIKSPKEIGDIETFLTEFKKALAQTKLEQCLISVDNNSLAQHEFYNENWSAVLEAITKENIQNAYDKYKDSSNPENDEQLLKALETVLIDKIDIVTYIYESIRLEDLGVVGPHITNFYNMITQITYTSEINLLRLKTRLRTAMQLYKIEDDPDTVIDTYGLYSIEDMYLKHNHQDRALEKIISSSFAFLECNAQITRKTFFDSEVLVHLCSILKHYEILTKIEYYDNKPTGLSSYITTNVLLELQTKELEDPISSTKIGEVLSKGYIQQLEYQTEKVSLERQINLLSLPAVKEAITSKISNVIKDATYKNKAASFTRAITAAMEEYNQKKTVYDKKTLKENALNIQTRFTFIFMAIILFSGIVMLILRELGYNINPFPS